MYVVFNTSTVYYLTLLLPDPSQQSVVKLLWHTEPFVTKGYMDFIVTVQMCLLLCYSYSTRL